MTLSTDIVHLSLALEGTIVPKARPREYRGRFLLPKNYREWKENAIAELQIQYQGKPLSGVYVLIQLHGKHNRRGDSDNIAGSILDALVQARILQDDSLMHVLGLSLVVEWSKQPATTQIVITDY